MRKLKNSKYELLEYSLYSPDFNLFDFRLTLNLKEFVVGKLFGSHEVTAASVYWKNVGKIVLN